MAAKHHIKQRSDGPKSLQIDNPTLEEILDRDLGKRGTEVRDAFEYELDEELREYYISLLLSPPSHID